VLSERENKKGSRGMTWPEKKKKERKRRGWVTGPRGEREREEKKERKEKKGRERNNLTLTSVGFSEVEIIRSFTRLIDF
jgi:hypothetical protein